ncbi:glutathione S-transferase [Actibacterium mucosum KCTC 23349]|uniref:Glutathione S-transferase n=1 Tax=Actibacterium mucosum KCTC 23349 TaxID=1454373 RepID=A0A037ZQI0_9RHOB|nr:glutathione S-transferase [Actibacterium mucosum]KAJ57112.1 glutathione S-transferase [Actibacterium mucosum KCTC 23349]
MKPILYSFRRCPYAMRARLALASAGVPVELREVVLRDKPEAFLAASASATVPCLKTRDEVIDESFDIMLWALKKNDPEAWLTMPTDGHALINRFDSDFKSALDHYKYPNRYAGIDPMTERDRAVAILNDIEPRLCAPWLFGPAPTLADMAILPFVRQFAMVDKPWFDGLALPGVQGWLERFLASDRLAAIMSKYPQWAEGDAPTIFPKGYDAS